MHFPIDKGFRVAETYGISWAILFKKSTIFLHTSSPFKATSFPFFIPILGKSVLPNPPFPQDVLLLQLFLKLCEKRKSPGYLYSSLRYQFMKTWQRHWHNLLPTFVIKISCSTSIRSVIYTGETRRKRSPLSNCITKYLTPWLISNNSYPEPIQPNSSYWYLFL